MKEVIAYGTIKYHWFFFIRYRCFYIDSFTRIAYGFHFSTMGNGVKLQRRVGNSWRNRAWTYSSTHRDLDSMIDYLKWYEEQHSHKLHF